MIIGIYSIKNSLVLFQIRNYLSSFLEFRFMIFLNLDLRMKPFQHFFPIQWIFVNREQYDVATELARSEFVGLIYRVNRNVFETKLSKCGKCIPKILNNVKGKFYSYFDLNTAKKY